MFRITPPPPASRVERRRADSLNGIALYSAPFREYKSSGIVSSTEPTHPQYIYIRAHERLILPSSRCCWCLSNNNPQRGWFSLSRLSTAQDGVCRSSLFAKTTSSSEWEGEGEEEGRGGRSNIDCVSDCRLPIYVIHVYSALICKWGALNTSRPAGERAATPSQEIGSS